MEAMPSPGEFDQVSARNRTAQVFGPAAVRLRGLNMKACRSILDQTLRSFLVVVLTCFSAQAAALEKAGPRWACWYEDSNLTVRCVLSRAPSDREAGLRALELLRKIDRRLGGLVRTLRANPEQLAGRRINIPLWNVPYEMSFVRQLAESVMCGVRTDCEVSFDFNPDGRAAARVIALLAQSGLDDINLPP